MNLIGHDGQMNERTRRMDGCTDNPDSRTLDGLHDLGTLKEVEEGTSRNQSLRARSDLATSALG
jgi:hypothetical protein